VEVIKYVFIDQNENGLDRKNYYCPYKALNPTSRKMCVLLTNYSAMTLSITDTIWSPF
jgi:hypothetical protein